MTYSSSLALSRQRIYARSDMARRENSSSAWGKNRNTTSFEDRQRKLGPISNTIVLIVLACLLGLLYLTQVTKTNAYSYQINALNQQQSNLTQEHNDLEVASARLQALDRVQNSSEAKKLVSVAPVATVTN